ncbi:ABC transporter substrate-binding protein [Nocardia coubleae]|uniref:ABC transporter substrate-binding protein n=1 Tax=Nocardia coubleae TaxID=356147 RepID=A0A846WCB0_9NOCA|nr:ABC transporter substrate-binding protein [Nocardia coubleae]NKX91142.1 ABC transporter substrate-binding protein [Nocardia coubleae]
MNTPLSRRLAAAAAVAAAVLSLSACGQERANPGAASSDCDTASNLDGGAYPRTIEKGAVKDAAGADVGTVVDPATIATRPVRVAALDQTFVDAALVLDTELVAYTTYQSMGDKLPAFLGASAQTCGGRAVNIGNVQTPDIEKLAGARPDLIVSAKVRHEKQYEQFRGIKLGSGTVPVVFSQTTGATWKENLLLLAKAVDKENLAKAKLTAYQDRAAAIGAAIKAKNGGTAPTVSLLRFMGKEDRLMQRVSFIGDIFADTGLNQPDKSADPKNDFAITLSPERLLDADADYVFLTSSGEDAATQRKAAAEANPLWNQLRGKITPVDDLVWLTSVGLTGAHAVLDDIAATFGVDPAK